MKKRLPVSQDFGRTYRLPQKRSLFALFVSLQSRGRKWPCAHDLVHFPLDQLESRKASHRVGIACGDLLSLLPRSSADNVNTELAIGRRTREENFSAFMLLFHPDQMLVQGDSPLFARFHRTSKHQVPHDYLPTNFAFSICGLTRDSICKAQNYTQGYDCTGRVSRTFSR